VFECLCDFCFIIELYIVLILKNSEFTIIVAQTFILCNNNTCKHLHVSYKLIGKDIREAKRDKYGQCHSVKNNK